MENYPDRVQRVARAHGTTMAIPLDALRLVAEMLLDRFGQARKTQAERPAVCAHPTRAHNNSSDPRAGVDIDASDDTGGPP